MLLPETEVTFALLVGVTVTKEVVLEVDVVVSVVVGDVVLLVVVPDVVVVVVREVVELLDVSVEFEVTVLDPLVDVVEFITARVLVSVLVLLLNVVVVVIVV